MTNQQRDFYALKNITAISGIVVAYLVISFFLIGFKTDQLVLAGLFCFAWFASTASRKFILGFSIFIVYWILFDYMKAFPNYAYNQVRILEIYQTEKQLFGIQFNGALITPNEFWLQHATTLLDIVSGLFYLCWIPVPLAFAAWLFFVDKKIFLQFSITFVLVNMLGFVIYYAYPAAPPWYQQQYGNHFFAHTNGSSAGLQRFDDYINAGVFKAIYQKSSNVFAAIPSLHSSYGIVVLYYGIKKKLGWVNILFVIETIGIWFAAVYTSHHYLLDVLAGIICAITGIIIFQQGLLKMTAISKLLARYLSVIN